jgi:hypothetical protein
MALGGCPWDGRAARLFFRIVNQVLVRLWTRRLVEDPCERVPTACDSPYGERAGIAKSDRPRSGWVATPGGIQPSDRRHIDQRRFADVLVVMAGMSVCAS